MRPLTWINTAAFREYFKIRTLPRLIIKGSHRPRKKNLEQPIENKLPGFEHYIVLNRKGSAAVSGTYCQHFNKLVKDIYRLYHGEFKCNDVQRDRLRQEIGSSILLFITEQWRKYKQGKIDKFPPYPGYVYVSTKGLMQTQFGKFEDVLGMQAVEHYNTIEGGFEMPSGLFVYAGHKPGEHGSRFGIPDDLKNKKPYYKENEEPDMVDIWSLGFSIPQMGMIFEMTHQQVRNRLHGLYDAMKKSKCRAKPERERPYKRPHKP